jgi:hypothetical protein
VVKVEEEGSRVLEASGIVEEKTLAEREDMGGKGREKERRGKERRGRKARQGREGRLAGSMATILKYQD